MVISKERNGNGESVYKVFGLPLGSYFAPIAGTTIIGIAIWLIQLNADVSWAIKNRADPNTIIALSKDLINLKDNVNNMQTPLSNRVTIAESAIHRLNARIDQHSGEIISGTSRCEKLWQRVDEIRRDLDRVIIRLEPHP